MLAMNLQIGFGDKIWIRHIVLLGFACGPMCATTVLLSPTNGCINGYRSDVNTLGHQFTRHAFREPGFAMARCGKSAAQWKAFLSCAGVGKNNGAATILLHWVFQHADGGLLSDQKRAHRGVEHSLGEVLPVRPR